MPYKYFPKDNDNDEIYRVDPEDGIPQFVANCRNSYYARLFLAALQFETEELAKLLVLVHGQGNEWKPIFDKINGLLADRTQDWNE